VLPTQEIIDQLAERIERAYALRQPGAARDCSTQRVWAAAALRLWQAHVEDPTLPLDSELFVASQPIAGSSGDPWVELTQAEAGRRYRQQVHRIIRRLRAELRREVRRAERMIAEDLPLVAASVLQKARLSPLGCYIAAYRMGRADMAILFARGAVEQHRACPLYQVASVAFLPANRYPVDDGGPASAREEAGTKESAPCSDPIVLPYPHRDPAEFDQRISGSGVIIDAMLNAVSYEPYTEERIQYLLRKVGSDAAGIEDTSSSSGGGMRRGDASTSRVP
jgi:hypothetical protein